MAVVVAGRLILDDRGDGADATTLRLFQTPEELAMLATGLHYLRD